MLTGRRRRWAVTTAVVTAAPLLVMAGVQSASAADGWSRIEAESYNTSGGTLQVCSTMLCYLGANSWAQYNGVDLHTGTTTLQLNVANGGGNSAVQVQVGGTTVGTLTVAGTGGWNTFQTKTLTLPAQTGVKDVRLTFVNGNLNVDWLSFTGSGTTPTPTPTPTPTTTTPPPTSSAGGVKPRVINTTDLGADPDDLESLVRMLVYANEVDIEGIIGGTSCWKPDQTASNVSNLLNPRLNAYGQVLGNLQKHASGYPSLSYLQSISKVGQTGYGMSAVGSGKDTAGSDLIVAAVDKNDSRPVWVNLWGGANTVAQALWKVKNTRSQSQVDAFVSKLRIYDVLGQDEAGAWIAKTFPNLLYIRARNQVYGWQPTDSWVDSNVQNKGALGAQYPEKAYAYEGDTPAFLYQIPNGLSDPDKVDWGSWGGRFGSGKSTGVRGMTESGRLGAEPSYDPYSMYTDAGEGGGAISRWGSAIHNDFAARMLWSVTGSFSGANHAPSATLNGDNTKKVLQVSASAGSTVNVSATGSNDPDNNSLSYSWSFYDEPSSYNGSVTINNSGSASAGVQVPSNAGGKNLHIILTVKDSGSPALTSYRRLIINVR